MAKREVEVKLNVDSSGAVRNVKDVKTEMQKMAKARDEATDPKKIKQLNAAIGDLKKEQDALTSATEETAKSQGGLGESMDGLTGAAGGVVGGVKGVLKSFTALVMHPVGLILTAIVGVLTLLYKSFTRTEAGSNKLGKGMAMLSGAFSGLLKVLEPVANFIIDKVVGAFETLGKVSDWVFSAVGKGLKALGFDGAADSLNKWTKAIEDNQKAAMKLADADAELIKLKREQTLIDMRTRLEAEKIRQLRDDESNSLQDRIKYNKQLGALLKKGGEEEGVIVAKQLAAALMRQKLEGASTEVLDEIAEAKLAILEVDERIAGFQSEMLANENSMRNEGIALSKEKKALKEAEMKQAADDKAASDLKIEQEKQALLDLEQAKVESGLRTIEADAELKLLRAEMGLEDPNKTADQHALDLENKLMALQTSYEAERELKLMQFEEDGITAEEQKALLELAEQEHINRLTAIKVKSINDIKTEEDKASAFKKKNEQLAAQGTVKTTQAVLGAVSSLLAEGSAEAKAIALAQATISGVQGVQAAYTSASAVPIVGMVLGPLAAVAAGVVAAKNIQKISQQKTGAKKGGGGGGASFSAPAIAPSIKPETLFSSQNLEGQETESLGNNAGISQKVVVLESDISDAINNVNVIETDSEIG